MPPEVPPEWLSRFDQMAPEKRQAWLAKRDPAKAAIISKAYEEWRLGQVPLIPVDGPPTDLGPLAAVGRGREQEAGFGFADELRGVAGALGMGGHEQTAALGAASIAVPGLATVPWLVRGGQEVYNRLFGEEQSGLSLGDEYRVHRDASEALTNRVAAENPVAFNVGRGEGIAAGVAAPIGSAKTVGKTILTGAGVGGATSLGNSEADLTRGEFKEAGADVGVGVLAGGALAAGGVALGKAGKWASGKLKGRAEDKAFKSYDPSKADIQKRSVAERRELGRYGLENDLVKPGSSVKGIDERADKLRETEIQKLEDALFGVDEAQTRPVSPEQLAGHLEDEVLTRPFFAGPSEGTKAAKKLMEREVENIRSFKTPAPKGGGQPSDKLKFSEAEEFLKRDYQKEAQFDKANPDTNIQAYRQLAGALREEIDRQVMAFTPEGASEKFLNAKKSVSKAIPIAKITGGGAARMEKNLPVGLYDLAAGAVLGGDGGAIKRLVTTAIVRTLRSRGNSTAAVIYDELSKTLGDKAAETVVRNLMAKGVINMVDPEADDLQQLR